MTHLSVDAPAEADAKQLARLFAKYREPNQLRSAVEILITIIPLVLIWIAMWAALDLGYGLHLLLAIPAAGLLVRLFMIQHDCGHGSLFRNRSVNDWIGRVIGVLTLTPYGYWRRSHAVHHSTSGNLDRRGIGDIDTLTAGEYLARSRWGRLCYRAYRHPLLMFGLGPAYLFLLKHRVPSDMMSAGRGPWLSTIGTNGAIAAVAGVMIWLLGVQAFLLVHLPVMMLGASIGVWLFYVQHQFEETSWERDGAWNVHEAALHGSSHYDLPPVLRWFTANIGLHHIHHLCSRIPFYRLPSVLRDHPDLRNTGRITLMQSFSCVRLTLWDETARRLISFGELSALRRRRGGHEAGSALSNPGAAQT